MSTLAWSLYMGMGTLPPVQTLIPSSEHFGRISSDFSMLAILQLHLISLKISMSILQKKKCYTT